MSSVTTSENEAAKTQVSPAKEKYRVTNWPEYEKALVQRGNITVWMDKDHLNACWLEKTKTGKKGASKTYSDDAIQLLLMLKNLFKLPYRSVEGFARSLMHLMGLELRVPDHTQMSRRAATLAVKIPRRERTEPLHIVADSTGLKVYGEGEWKVRMHGVSKRRSWVKVHLAIDANAKDVVGLEVTTEEWGDCEVFDDLIEQVEGNIEQIDVDGAYDTKEAYQTAAKREAKLVVPPREGAVYWEEGHPRNAALDKIADKGRKVWKQESGYHRRSLAENAMYRMKQLFEDKLSSRQFDTQVTEVHVRVALLNMMTYLGMPNSVKVAV